MSKLKPCPFCGSTELDYSLKVASRKRNSSVYHASIYCKKCFCYGKRVLIKPTEQCLIDIAENITYKQKAIKAWNTRYNEN